MEQKIIRGKVLVGDAFGEPFKEVFTEPAQNGLLGQQRPAVDGGVIIREAFPAGAVIFPQFPQQRPTVDGISPDARGGKRSEGQMHPGADASQAFHLGEGDGVRALLMARAKVHDHIGRVALPVEDTALFRAADMGAGNVRLF